MKLPSLQTLWLSAKNVALRFPLQFLIALISTAIWWHIIDLDFNEQQHAHNWVTALCVCNLALTLLLSTDLFSESHQYSNLKKTILRIAVLAICVGLYVILDPWAYLADVYRIMILALAFHLLVAFAPFIGKSNLNGFWQYNRMLFLRFLTSAFYAAVLYAGLAVALLAIDELFNADINYKWYLKLLSLMGATFTTIFFLSGIPANFEALDEDQTYPKGLKIFTQYVLIPLMTIYLGILLVYEVKIVFLWTMPKGLVSLLVLGYAVFGILSLLLIYPIKDKEGNAWMKLFSRFFYLMMIPLVILLLLAIGRRVGHYGITESRYILTVLAIWLTAITIYFLLSKKQNIKLIPISLCILALLATYGPQSAFSVSKYSQVSRLKKLLKSKNKKEINQQAEVVRYLVERHGLTSLQSFTTTDLSTIDEKINANAEKKQAYDYAIKRQKIDTAFYILKVKDQDFDNNTEHLVFTNENTGVLDIKGYDAVLPLRDYTDTIKKFDGNTFKFTQHSTQKESSNINRLTIKIDKEPSFNFNLTAIKADAVKTYQADKSENKVYNGYVYPANKMELRYQNNRYEFKLVIDYMSGVYNKDIKDFENFDFSGYLLVKKK